MLFTVLCLFSALEDRARDTLSLVYLSRAAMAAAESAVPDLAAVRALNDSSLMIWCDVCSLGFRNSLELS